jgi:PBP1b-binding outer membrane lipoprotein LpoB
MKLIATLIATAFVASAFAAEPAKVEAVKKPEATTAVPVTPKEMPKVAKPEPLNNKAKSEATPAKSEAAKPAKKDEPKATTPAAK